MSHDTARAVLSVVAIFALLVLAAQFYPPYQERQQEIRDAEATRVTTDLTMVPFRTMIARP